jgi:hypothetical protein
VTARTFEVEPARRERTIVTVGFVGYSGSGKTFSMLRFAAGMQDAIGGKTVLVDSNLKRSLYYAPKPGELAVRGQTFDFEVVHLPPPHDSASWRAAYQRAIDRGATRIIGDCMSDEWEGDGGVLDAHERAIDEMVGRKRAKGNNDPEWKLRDRLSNTAWIKVKRAHLELRLWMWQQPVDWLISFRAKKKIDPSKKADGNKNDGKEQRIDRGWQPIGGNELVYDLMLRCLLPPSSDGSPNWNPETDEEKLLVKPPPGPIRELLRAHPQVNEELGYQIARWATGHDIEIRPTRAAAAAPAAPAATATSNRRTSPPPSRPPVGRPHAAVLVERYDACRSRDELEQIKADARAAWDSIPRGTARTDVSEAFKSAEARIAAAAAAAAPTSSPASSIDDDEANEILAAEAARNRLEGEHAP